MDKPPDAAPEVPSPKKKRAPRKRSPKAQAASAIPDNFGLTDPHVLRGLDYARKVVGGEIVACKFVQKACERQLRDLERSSKDPAWGFDFVEAKSSRAARFLEQLPHVKGAKGGQLLVLEPWQCFVITTIFGWIRRSTGGRRFRRAYVEVPRGNGKSFLSSGIALYGLAADGEAGAEVYSAATTTEQALIVWGDADAMLTKRPVLVAKLGLKQLAHHIVQPASNSKFKALSREAKNQDGKNIHVAVVDELHAHPNRALWDVLITGAGKRPQSLIWAITTAGTDTSGICYEVRDSVVKMLDPGPGIDPVENDALFGIIYTLDEGDDWKLESSWIKANPNWFSSIDLDLFRMNATEAMQTSAKENNFKTKHLNIWCNAEVAWMQMQAWDACADPSLKEQNFDGLACIIGLDLASKVDIAAKAKLFYRDIPIGLSVNEGAPELERHYYLFVTCYLPEGAVERSKNAQYVGWSKDGWLKTTEGDVLDFDRIKEDVLGDVAKHNVRELAFDPWQAQMLMNELQKQKALVVVEVRPTVENFSEPMKEMEALVLTKRFHHDGNPVMRWMISNVVCHRDAKDNIYPRKERPENKIDGPVAAIMALNRTVHAPVAKSDPYTFRGFLQL